MTQEAARELGRNLYDVVIAYDRFENNPKLQSVVEIDRERGDANELLRNWNATASEQERAALNQALMDTGVLPRLAVDLSADMDGNGADGTEEVDITREELQARIDDPNADPLTKLAAETVLKYFDQIDRMDDADGVLTAEEIRWWHDEKIWNDMTQSPEDLFADPKEEIESVQFSQ